MTRQDEITHISTTVYSQVLIYTAESTGASMERRKMPNLPKGTKGGFEHGLTWLRIRHSTTELPRSTKITVKRIKNVKRPPKLVCGKVNCGSKEQIQRAVIGEQRTWRTRERHPRNSKRSVQKRRRKLQKWLPQHGMEFVDERRKSRNRWDGVTYYKTDE